MKRLPTLLSAALLALTIAACEEPAELEISNTMDGAVLRNVRWGDLHVVSELYPGETSPVIKIYDQNYANIDLPETHPIRFYLDVDGDQIYLETREEFTLEVKNRTDVVIDDTTEVFNPALDPE